jgi:hypothetical protein
MADASPPPPGADNIRVLARLRPALNAGAAASGAAGATAPSKVCLAIPSPGTISLSSGGLQTFAFDQTVASSASQVRGVASAAPAMRAGARRPRGGAAQTVLVSRRLFPYRIPVRYDPPSSPPHVSRLPRPLLPQAEVFEGVRHIADACLEG